MFCKKCGKEIKDTAKFCGYCGCANDSRVIGVNSAVGNTEVNTNWAQQGSWGNTKTEAVSKDIDLKSEIRQNIVILAIPLIYLVWAVVRVFLNMYLAKDFDSLITYLYIAAIIGSILYGAVSGGLVVAINNFSKNFKWIYLIPYVVVFGFFFIINLGELRGANGLRVMLQTMLDFFEVIVSMAVIIALKHTQFGKGDSMKSTVIVASMSAVAGVLVIRFLYYLLFLDIFTWWDIIRIVITTIGAVITAALTYNFVSAKTANNTQR